MHHLDIDSAHRAVADDTPSISAKTALGMKYLFTIIGIICIATLVTIYLIWPTPEPEEIDVAVTINGHQLARKTVDAEGVKTGYHSDEQNELLDSMITRQLLIQEAQRQQIDKEPNFRAALKTFYEQSLIKVLMDRQYAKIEVDVTETELDRYLSFYGKTIIFTRLAVDTNPPHQIIPGQETQNEVLFDDLADPLKFLISTLTPGEHTIKYDTGTEQYAIRLDKIVPSTKSGARHLPDRQSLRQTLQEYKRQQQITAWVTTLRRQASITIHNK